MKLQRLDRYCLCRDARGPGRAAAAAALCVLAATLLFIPAASGANDRCEPAGGLHFICGADHPEDLAHIPGTRWLIASGFLNGAGLKLVDTDSKSLRFWYSAVRDQIRWDRSRYPMCPAAPNPAVFNAHGIALRANSAGGYTLYVVNHGGRESIEVFGITVSQDVPLLRWEGCVPMPAGLAANSVASYPDGTILATVLARPGTTYADFVEGKNTGGVYQWKPGDKSFSLLPGTELPGNNGLETSRDGKEFYVVAYGLHEVFVYSRSDTTKPLRHAVAPDFMPDNIHWDGDQLITAGMVYDEPACGGVRKVIHGVADPMLCHRGYKVAQFNPKTMTFTILAQGQPDPRFNGVTTAVVIGRNLWIGSYQANCIAYRRLPSADSVGAH